MNFFNSSKRIMFNKSFNVNTLLKRGYNSTDKTQTKPETPRDNIALWTAIGFTIGYLYSKNKQPMPDKTMEQQTYSGLNTSRSLPTQSFERTATSEDIASIIKSESTFSEAKKMDENSLVEYNIEHYNWTDGDLSRIADREERIVFKQLGPHTALELMKKIDPAYRVYIKKCQKETSDCQQISSFFLEKNFFSMKQHNSETSIVERYLESETTDDNNFKPQG
jgi:hypothetical protein